MSPPVRSRYSERTSDISGDYLDSLIREQQIASGRIAHPPDAHGLPYSTAVPSAKEQLTTAAAVALPRNTGWCCCRRRICDALIMLAVESSARMTRDVIVRSDRAVQAVVVIGGCAQIPQVARVVERSLRVPVVVPEQPETVVARGAALLARPARTVAQPPVSFDAKTEVLPVVREDGSLAPRRRVAARGTPALAGRVGQRLGGLRTAAPGRRRGGFRRT